MLNFYKFVLIGFPCVFSLFFCKLNMLSFINMCTIDNCLILVFDPQKTKSEFITEQESDVTELKAGNVENV